MAGKKRSPHFQAKLSALVSQVKRSLPQTAIDHAFITHTVSLFERLCNDIKVQTKDGSGLDHARSQFASDFSYARQTHQEMNRHLESIVDADL